VPPWAACRAVRVGTAGAGGAIEARTLQWHGWRRNQRACRKRRLRRLRLLRERGLRSDKRWMVARVSTVRAAPYVAGKAAEAAAQGTPMEGVAGPLAAMATGGVLAGKPPTPVATSDPSPRLSKRNLKGQWLRLISPRCVNPRCQRVYSSSEPRTLPVFGLTRCVCAHARHVTWT
jgi:hypothetical protein